MFNTDFALVSKLEIIFTVIQFLLLVFYATEAHKKQTWLEISNTAFIACFILPKLGFQWSVFYLIVSFWVLREKY